MHLNTLMRNSIRKASCNIARNPVVAAALRCKGPPILLLSYPRSGSSWIGAVLSESESVLYMREPITQPYLREGGKYALIDIDGDSRIPASYSRLADEAFAGRPSPYDGVVDKATDFLRPDRRFKRLLIKEVNPRASAFFCEHYSPAVILIVRHPAAVALSFSQRGWLSCADTQMDTGGENADPWERFGYAYASAMQHAIETIQNRAECNVISYEEFALEPRISFKSLFNRLSLEMPKKYDAVINRYCFSETSTSHAFAVARKAVDEIWKWRRELTAGQIEAIRNGYLRFSIARYRDSSDWER